MRSRSLVVVAALVAVGLSQGGCARVDGGAEAAREKVVLVLTPDWSSTDEARDEFDAVRRSLELAGYDAQRARVVGRMVSDEGSAEARDVKAAVAETRPDVVITTTMALAAAVQRQNPELPLAFSGSTDPVAACLVDSMLVPGRRTSGYTGDIDAEAKMLELLLDAFPSVRRVTILVDAKLDVSSFECGEPSLRRQAQVVAERGCAPGRAMTPSELDWIVNVAAYVEAATQHGVTAEFVRVCGWGDVEEFVRNWKAAGGALIVVNKPLFQTRAVEAVALLNTLRLPIMFEGWRFAEAGGLMAVGAHRGARLLQDTSEVAMLALTGLPLATVPVRAPSGVDLLINLKTAKASGLYPSMQALRRADVLIR